MPKPILQSQTPCSLHPWIEVTASSIIENPNYTFPDDRIVQTYPLEDQPKGTTIVQFCKFSVRGRGLTLLFNDDKITCFLDSNNFARQEHNPWFTPLLYFIIFKTFLNYNVYGFPKQEFISLVDTAPEVDKISFNLGRLVRKEGEDQIAGKKVKTVWHDTEPYLFTLGTNEIHEFLDILNENLYLAVCYYLIGCQNIRYFLIEYYKAVEAIKNYFGTEKQMKEQLRPHGFKYKKEYKKLKQYANGEREPLDIGRHAPKKGTKLFIVDFKRLAEEPKSKEIFEESSRICRNMIEIFMRYLAASLGTPP
jgi:hypothetical protein